MPPSRLRVLAGPSPSSLKPITVNTFQAHDISSDRFEGKIVVHIKGFNDTSPSSGSPYPTPTTSDDDYFNRKDRQGITWSIQVQGRFLQPQSADDVLFGNTFDRALKLPWGTSAILKFMHFVDPTLVHDLQGRKPWALSPLVSTMPYFAHKRVDGGGFGGSEVAVVEEFPGRVSLEDDVTQLHLAVRSSSSTSTGTVSPSGSTTSTSSRGSTESKRQAKKAMIDHLKIRKRRASIDSCSSGSTSTTSSARKSIVADLKGLRTAAQRRSYFSSEEKRKQVIFGPDDLITVDFCYGFLSFSGSSGGPRLDLPAGLHFDLGKYWDGQPVRFVCCERKKSGDNAGAEEEESDPWGPSFWCVAIEMEQETGVLDDDGGEELDSDLD